MESVHDFGIPALQAEARQGMIRKSKQLDKSVELEEVVVPPSDPPSVMRSRMVQLLA